MDGDDVQFGAGVHNPITIPRVDTGMDMDETIISGDPAVSRQQVIFRSDAGQPSITSVGGTPGSDATRWLTIKHLTFRTGTRHGIRLAGTHWDTVITDVEIGPGDFDPNFCCRSTTSPRAAAIGFELGTRSIRVTVSNSRLIAPADTSSTVKTDPKFCVGPICGVNGNAMLFDASAVVVRDVEARHFMGAFVQEAHAGSIIERNLVTDTACDAGDGCVYSYNDNNFIVRRNVFDRIVSQGSFPAIRARQSATDPNLDTYLYAYNNTIIGIASYEQEPEVGVQLAPPNPTSSWPTQEAIILNNLFYRLGQSVPGAYGYFAVELNQCPDGPLAIDHNGYYEIALDPNGVPQTLRNDPAAGGSNCPGPLDANSLIGANPQLNTNYAPPTGSLLCLSGTTGFTPPGSADQSSAYIGARACEAPPSGGGGSGGCGGCQYQEN